VRLVLLGRDEDRLRSVASGLNAPAEDALLWTGDLTRPEEAAAAAASTLARFGRVDILLQLLGGWTGGANVPDLPDETLADMLSRHLWSTWHLARAFVPHLLDNGWGRIVAVSHPVAAQPVAGQAAYAVAKAAEEALILALAAELRGSGVTANLIIVRTIDERHERDREPGARTPSRTTPEEIAAAIMYLCSDEARVVNGVRLPLHQAG
jgi:NAD(P)-dependent dehydrogenase (short-subunit alcohol dehydrogenase family)